jgi:hypothetical protein
VTIIWSIGMTPLSTAIRTRGKISRRKDRDRNRPGQISAQQRQHHDQENDKLRVSREPVGGSLGFHQNVSVTHFSDSTGCPKAVNR